MLRVLFCGVRQMQKNTIRSITQLRNFSDHTQIIMGGGLEKPQGGLKEEKYFYAQNYDLITKLREQGTQLKCENCVGDWKVFEKVLNVSVVPTALRETCSLNKHKNCLEEAFFLNEQNECCTKLIKESKLLNDSNLKNETENVQQQENIDDKEQ